MKGNIYKYICNFQKREELSHLADQDSQRKFGVWAPLRDKHMKLYFFFLPHVWDSGQLGHFFGAYFKIHEAKKKKERITSGELGLCASDWRMLHEKEGGK